MANKSEVLILDQNFDTFAILDQYQEFIWTDRYSECGDFEISTVATPEMLDILRQDYYVYFSSSEHLMIIEKVVIDSDAEDGSKLTVSGRSLESILDRRVVWGQVIIQDTFQNAIRQLLMNNIINPKDPNRRIENFVFSPSSDEYIAKLNVDVQYFGDDLYSIITDMCKNFNVGFKIVLNDKKQFIFSLYYSVFRNYEQTVNPYVVFSPDYGNLANSNYICTKEKFKNVSLVAGEGEGSDRMLVAYSMNSSTYTGLERREVYTDANDISQTTEEGELTDDAYADELKAKAAENLTEYIITETFEGETVGKQYEYGKDFFVGDVVTMQNEYGKSSISRIVEYIFSRSAREFKQYPTFETVVDIDSYTYKNYSDKSKYKVGDMVMKDEQIYECIEEIKEPEIWDPSKWLKKGTKPDPNRHMIENLFNQADHDYNKAFRGDIELKHSILDYDFLLFACGNSTINSDDWRAHHNKRFAYDTPNYMTREGEVHFIISTDYLVHLIEERDDPKDHGRATYWEDYCQYFRPLAEDFRFSDDYMTIKNPADSGSYGSVYEVWGIGRKIQHPDYGIEGLYGHYGDASSLGKTVQLAASANNYSLLLPYTNTYGMKLDYYRLDTGGAMIPRRLWIDKRYDQKVVYQHEMGNIISVDISADGNVLATKYVDRYTREGFTFLQSIKYKKVDLIFNALDNPINNSDFELQTSFMNYDMICIVVQCAIADLYGKDSSKWLAPQIFISRSLKHVIDAKSTIAFRPTPYLNNDIRMEYWIENETTFRFLTNGKDVDTKYPNYAPGIAAVYGINIGDTADSGGGDEPIYTENCSYNIHLSPSDTDILGVNIKVEQIVGNDEVVDSYEGKLGDMGAGGIGYDDSFVFHDLAFNGIMGQLKIFANTSDMVYNNRKTVAGNAFFTCDKSCYVSTSDKVITDLTIVNGSVVTITD